MGITKTNHSKPHTFCTRGNWANYLPKLPKFPYVDIQKYISSSFSPAAGALHLNATLLDCRQCPSTSLYENSKLGSGVRSLEQLGPLRRHTSASRQNTSPLVCISSLQPHRKQDLGSNVLTSIAHQTIKSPGARECCLNMHGKAKVSESNLNLRALNTINRFGNQCLCKKEK